MEIADKAQNTRTVQQGAGSGDFLGTLDETERSRKYHFPLLPIDSLMRAQCFVLLTMVLMP